MQAPALMAMLGGVNAPNPRRLSGRWDLWLPLAGLLVALALAGLGTTAAGALRESRTLAREGELLHFVHGLERDLREGGPASAGAAVERAYRERPWFVAGLALRTWSGEVQVRAGTLDGLESREHEMFLGREWAMPGAGPGPGSRRPGERFMGGRRTIRIALSPDAFRPTALERIVAPAALVSGALLAGLAVLGGRLLMRQREEQEQEATRRRLEGLGRAGAGLAHQLRNPLGTIKGSCQLLLERASDPAEEKRLRSILEQTVRMERLIGQLLDYARPPRSEPAQVEMAVLLREIAARHPSVQVRVDAPLRLHADPEHLRQIVENLVDNALAASPPGEAVEVTVEAPGHGPEVKMVIADRGPGPGEDPERHFEPYVTSRADGTGLGLPIARALAEANGGTVVLRPRPGGGTLAILSLPQGTAA